MPEKCFVITAVRREGAEIHAEIGNDFWIHHFDLDSADDRRRLRDQYVLSPGLLDRIRADHAALQELLESIRPLED